MTNPAAVDEPAVHLSPRARLEILGAILLALFLLALDQTVVGTALSGTGDLGARILNSVPEAFRPQVQPLIPGIVQAIHESFSIAIASTFWVSIAAAIVASVFVLFLREQPMRSTFEMTEAASPDVARA